MPIVPTDLMRGLVDAVLDALIVRCGDPHRAWDALRRAFNHTASDALGSYLGSHPRQPVPLADWHALAKAWRALYGDEAAREIERLAGRALWVAAPDDAPRSLYDHTAPAILGALRARYGHQPLDALPETKFLLAFNTLGRTLAQHLPLTPPHISATDLDYEIAIVDCPFCGGQHDDCRWWWGIADGLVAWLDDRYTPRALARLPSRIDTDNSRAHQVVIDYADDTVKGCRAC